MRTRHWGTALRIDGGLEDSWLVYRGLRDCWVFSSYLRRTMAKAPDHSERNSSGTKLIGPIAPLLQSFKHWFTTRHFTRHGGAALTTVRINLRRHFIATLSVIVGSGTRTWPLCIVHQNGDSSRKVTA